MYSPFSFDLQAPLSGAKFCEETCLGSVKHRLEFLKVGLRAMSVDAVDVVVVDIVAVVGVVYTVDVDCRRTQGHPNKVLSAG